MPDGEAIQNELAKLTGQRTVPNIFIGGVHLGGNDGSLASEPSMHAWMRGTRA